MKSTGSSSSSSCPLILSLVGLFFAMQLPGTSGQNVTEKAGTCPTTVTTSGNCTEECQSDDSCEENQKCCPIGCGTSCQVPDGTYGSLSLLSPSVAAALTRQTLPGRPLWLGARGVAARLSTS
uniref:Uncharacterized protein n=1 Tax=Sphaerodactylus townsendi TaxID=933632 RepID=A0ACB8F7K7_9SAUR